MAVVQITMMRLDLAIVFLRLDRREAIVKVRLAVSLKYKDRKPTNLKATIKSSLIMVDRIPKPRQVW
jgi:hypothetical protein